jgi:cbb3-type cytochrome oxidase maturation protein
MSVLFVILPIALVIAGCAVVAFIMATRSGQFDDLDSPPHRAIHADRDTREKPRQDGTERKF